MFVGGHGLVRGQAPGDLHDLHDEEHGYPEELEGGPNGEDDGEGVAVEGCAEGGGEYIACC